MHYVFRQVTSHINDPYKEQIPVAIAIQSGNFNVVIGSNLTLIASSKSPKKSGKAIYSKNYLVALNYRY